MATRLFMAYLHPQIRIPITIPSLIPIPVVGSWHWNINLTPCSMKSSTSYMLRSHLVLLSELESGLESRSVNVNEPLDGLRMVNKKRVVVVAGNK